MKVGNKVFYKHEPVIYFDSLKTSTLEGAATTVYATGGRGNARLAAWEGERTVTFTMEDALISTLGLAILTGAGVMDATAAKPVYQHVTETVKVKEYKADTEADAEPLISLKEKPHAINNEDYIYVMKLDDQGNVMTEPFIYINGDDKTAGTVDGITITSVENVIIIKDSNYSIDYTENADHEIKAGDVVLVDYYVKRTADAQEITITADKFGGNFYVEASTLFRDAGTGVDMPAEFIIPNAKVQSNFTFTMASSGDPSTFTFTMDAFPDYTRFNKEEKVFSAIQIITDATSDDYVRVATDASASDKAGTDKPEKE